MDHIRKAILKAKAAQRDRLRHFPADDRVAQGRPVRAEYQGGGSLAEPAHPLFELSPQHLERYRIVAHLPHSPHSIGFDVLRTRVFQAMRERGWQTLLVTSPTPGCGKTVTSINLAISLARQPRCSAVLVDCDFRKPNISEYLGFRPRVDLHDILEGRQTVEEGLEGFSMTGRGLSVLATREVVPRPSEVLSSAAMKDLVSSIKNLSADTIAVFDVPPMMVADDVLAFLPDIDAVLLVVAPGTSSYADAEACLRMIPKEKLIGSVFTKFEEATRQSNYAGYAGY